MLSPPLLLVVLLLIRRKRWWPLWICGQEEEGAKIYDDFGPTKASMAIEDDVVLVEVVQQQHDTSCSCCWSTRSPYKEPCGGTMAPKKDGGATVELKDASGDL